MPCFPDGSLVQTIWQQVIGDDYLRIAFEAARAADPDAQLFYDDFYDDFAVTQDAVASGVPIVPGANAERTTCDAVPKCVAVRDRIAALVADGAPIDGIGFQSHLFSPDPADFAEFSDWVGELGLEWAVTEFDVPLPVTEITNAESLDFQADEYAQALAACVDAPNCDTFVTWGISDRFSPIPAESGGAFGGRPVGSMPTTSPSRRSTPWPTAQTAEPPDHDDPDGVDAERTPRHDRGVGDHDLIERRRQRTRSDTGRSCHARPVRHGDRDHSRTAPDRDITRERSTRDKTLGAAQLRGWRRR